MPKLTDKRLEEIRKCTADLCNVLATEYADLGSIGMLIALSDLLANFTVANGYMT